MNVLKFMKKQKTADMETGKSLRWLFLILSFLAPIEMMILVYAGSIVYPFGDETLLNMDLSTQYFPMFQEFIRKISAGEGLSYSWNVGLGSNYLVIFGNNLSSPLHWLVFLFPQINAIEFISYLVILKIGLAGLSSFIFFENRYPSGQNLNSFAALLFSSFYAMSGYVAAYNTTIMWLDGIILLPLILLGLERLVKEGKMRLYTIVLAICILSNYYLAFMICIFVVIYYCFLIGTEPKRSKSILRFLLGSVIAGGMAACILLPVACALFSSDVGSEGLPKTWEAYFSVFEIIARHCFGIKTSTLTTKWPNIFCGSAVFFLIPLYVMNAGIPKKKKIGMFGIALFLVMGFQWNVLDYLWHGLSFPRGFPARQSLLYVMIILCICHDCIANLQRLSVKAVLAAYGISVTSLLIAGRFFQSDDFHPGDWQKTLAFVTAYAVILCVYLTKEQSALRERLAVVCYLTVLTECTLNMFVTSVLTTDRNEYLNGLNDYKALYERHADDGEGIQRFENTSRRIEDDSALIGYPSASMFSSVANPRVIDFYEKMGMRYNRVYYFENEGATPLSSALLNVRFLFDHTNGADERLFHKIDQENELALYEATYRLPFGYVAPKGYDLIVTNASDAISLQNELARDLGIDGVLFVEEQITHEGRNACFVAQKDGIYYGLVKDPGIAKVSMKKEGGGAIFNPLKNNNVFFIGYLEEGQEVQLTNETLDATDIFIGVFRMDETTLKLSIQALSENCLSNAEVNNTMVSGHLNLEKPGRLITSIPYEKGWTVFVNGEKVPAETFGEALIALDFEPGEYQIEMKYVPEGWHLGILISVMSFLLFIGLEFFLSRKQKHKESLSRCEMG